MCVVVVCGSSGCVVVVMCVVVVCGSSGCVIVVVCICNNSCTCENGGCVESQLCLHRPTGHVCSSDCSV